MLKAWKEMEEKASQCAQVGHVKEVSSSLVEGDHDRNLVYVPPFWTSRVFHILPAVGMRISLRVVWI